MRQLVKDHTSLSEAEIDRLAEVTHTMQLLADLSYADILLFCRTEGGAFMVVAEAKPNTAISLYSENRVGTILDEPENPAVVEVFTVDSSQEVAKQSLDGQQIEIKAVPVIFDKEAIAVLSREIKLPGPTSEMEHMYMSMADQILKMVSNDELVGMGSPSFSTTRTAGDGIMKIESDGSIAYASPNAVSIYRRLGVEGNLVGRRIQEISRYEEAVVRALEAKRVRQKETTERGRTVLRRAIPLLDNGNLTGALAIVRDVTDLRRRDQELRIKEATIREIHHRVKNNLQTIASLLRLQARRLRSAEARDALLESVSRISSIAVVHEILAGQEAETVDFGELVGKISDVVLQGIGTHAELKVEVKGKSGMVPADTATSLAMVVTELMQNAFEHAFTDGRAGTVTVSLERRGRRLDVAVADDGVGLPKGFDLASQANLGLQIVQTLVHDELNGELKISSNRGTKVRISLGVPEREKET